MRTTKRAVSANRALLSVLCFFVFQLAIVSAQAQFRQIYGDSSANDQVTGMSFLSPSTGYVSFTGYAGFTTDSGHTFTRRDILFGNTNYNGYSVNLTFGFSTRGVVAFSKDSLLLYGDYGTEPSILFSADGGQTWKLVFHKNINGGASVFNQGVTDMEFPGNGSTGFAIHNEEVLKTTDRGQHWNVVVNVPDGIMRKLSFPASATGYAIGGEKIFKTTNSGSTWSQIALPASGSGSNFNNVFFTSVNTGFITDYEQHTFFKTTDGGSTWRQMNDAGLIPILANDIYFLNDSTGFYAPAYSYSVYKTTDSGKTWEPCKQFPKYQYLYYGLNALSFYNNIIGWAGGLADYLTITTTGGSPTLPTAYFKVDTAGLTTDYEVRLVNYSKPGYQYKWYRNDTLISTDYNASYIHYILQAHDNIKLVVSNGTDADTAQQDIYYEVRPLPAVTGFSPTTGSTGTVVIIYGSNFTNVTGVSFGGVPAASFTVVSAEQIKAIVGAGATGTVTVTVNNGTAGILPGFVYTAPPSLPPPVITAFAPLSGPVGTTVTISGNNFNTSPAGNVIYFGMAKAVVNSASATQLVCKVPAGASLQPILVLNTQTHLSGTSAKPFGVTFADSSNFTPHSFELGYNFDYSGNGSYPKQISTGDVDGDGKPDIIASVSRNYRDSVIVYRSTGTGDTLQFDAGTGMPNLSGSLVAQGDIDGDGKPDFVCPVNQGYVFVSRNISTPGKPASGPRIVVPTAAGALVANVTDLDGDGRPDLAVAAFNKAVSVIRNTSSVGAISFADKIDLETGGQAVSVATGDIDGDGKKDIVVSNFIFDIGQPSIFSYFKNNSTKGNLSFSAKTDVVTPEIGTQSSGIFMQDVDGDNKLDVIVLNVTSYTVYRNISANGNIAFEPYKEFNITGYGQGAYMENLSGDSKPDFISGDFGGRVFHYLDNTSVPGTVGYHDAINLQDIYPPIAPVYSSASADFNGDGKQDIVIGDIGTGDNYVSVLKNVIGKTIPFTTCVNDVSGITSDITGNTYQWQQNTGRGFSNIADNSNFSGTATATLSLSNIPASWIGYTYRCIAGDRKSTPYLLNVNTAPPTHVSISTHDTAAVCPGTKFTFTAKSTNAGGYPYFEWQINGKTIPNDGRYNVETLDSVSTFFSFVLEDSNQIRVIVHGYDACNNSKEDTSNVIGISVTGGGYPTVKITTSKPSVCTDEAVTFTATAKNSGKHPTYQWYIGAYESRRCVPPVAACAGPN